MSTALEVYFSRTLGFTLLTLGILTVLLTGSVPLSSSLAEGAFARVHDMFNSAKIRRRFNREHRPQSPLRTPHSHHYRHFPLCLCLLLLRHVDGDGRNIIQFGLFWFRVFGCRCAMVYSVCQQQRQD